jgi:hypothetical protein
MSFNNTTAIIDVPHVSSSIAVVLGRLMKRFFGHLPLIFIILGFIGFIGNTFTFLQSQLRSNTCCIYLLCGSIIDISNLLINCLSTYLGGKYGKSIPWSSSTSLCKLSLFMQGFPPHLSINFLVMSIIDRFALSCSLTSPIRRINQLKMVPWLISITISISALVSIRASLFDEFVVGVGCVLTSQTVNNILYIFLNGLMQPLVMLVFILLTFRNVNQSRRRVVSILIFAFQIYNYRSF